jgi:hypothetical protein
LIIIVRKTTAGSFVQLIYLGSTYLILCVFLMK